MQHLRRLLTSIPKAIDDRQTTVWIAIFLFPLIALVLLPTGILNSNEEYYFQVAALFWSIEPQNQYAAIQEKSSYLFLGATAIGLPVKWFGYVTANAILRVSTAAALAISFAHLSSTWKLSALDAILTLSIFVLIGQQFFGGEWILRGAEAKVFSYICVFLGLSYAFSEKWKPCVISMAIATYFHFLVGGFWTLIALVWLLSSRQQRNIVVRAAIIYSVLVMPLATAIVWQRIEGAAPDAAIETWYVTNVLRNPHHLAPFSNISIIWSWIPGITMLLGTLTASILSLDFKIGTRTRRLIQLLIGLQVYLIFALLISATNIGVRTLGNFYLFRPSSLTLLIVIASIFIVIRQLESDRLLVWIAAWVLIPIACWGVIKTKVEQVLLNPVESAEIDEMIDAATLATTDSKVVLIQPGRDGKHPELTLSRRMQRPTLVNWSFVPNVPKNVAIWFERNQFRVDLFQNGCNLQSDYPIGALIVRNEEMPPKSVIDSCGPIVWRGANYSVINVR